MCCHQGQHYYEAKIIDILKNEESGDTEYKIHYQGWNSRYDEIIPASCTEERWKPFSEEEAEKAKQKKKRKSKAMGSDERGPGSNSRSTTPQSSRTTGTYEHKATKSRRGEQHHAEPISDFARGRKEINIAIPDVLKQVLVDDYDQVIRQSRLNMLPANPTVEQIIKDYSNSLGRNVSNDEQIVIEYEGGSADSTFVSSHPTIIECAKGIQDFFDITFGSHMLTKFERPQYLDLLEMHKKKEPPKKRRLRADTDEALEEGFRPSTMYGLTHLLRLFVRFATLIQCAPWSDRSLATIIRQVHDFLVFLVRNVDKYYNKDAYDTATHEYQRKALNLG